MVFSVPHEKKSVPDNVKYINVLKTFFMLLLFVSFYNENFFVVPFHKIVFASETFYLGWVVSHFFVVHAVDEDIFFEFFLLFGQYFVLVSQPVVGHETVVVDDDKKQNEKKSTNNIFVTQYFKRFF